MLKKQVVLYWFRRDLRLKDNAGLAHALAQGQPVVPLFVFDRDILDPIQDRKDLRVQFIYQTVQNLNQQLKSHGSGLVVRYGKPFEVLARVLEEYSVSKLVTNRDYEPYAIHRDAEVARLCAERGVAFEALKDQVIFEKSEIVKKDRKPYTMFSPYAKRWKSELKPEHLKAAPSERRLSALLPLKSNRILKLEEMNFKATGFDYPSAQFELKRLRDYAETRDFPAVKGTSRLGLHLRFGTVSVRELVRVARKSSETWLGELIWREFFMMLLFHFPETLDHAFRSKFAGIQWLNSKTDFAAWCAGRTGYPLVDAGMRELNATGFMHNRVRMVAASFLCKHLLIDWRWGERYFADRLLDFDLASNVGNWQWVAGTGADAAPYFRIFNPATQLKKFDRAREYVKRWVPEIDTDRYPAPIVDHEQARTRTLKAYRTALR